MAGIGGEDEVVEDQATLVEQFMEWICEKFLLCGCCKMGLELIHREFRSSFLGLDEQVQ